jgi:pSer/pThr/pTyr-binding forkhead associated (FHA) protein
VSKDKPEQEFPTLKLSNMFDNSSKLFSSPEIYIGRDGNANFIVNDDSVSNIHNRIFWKEHAFWIEDLNSTNGTFLNDEKLVSPVTLYSGDIIKCGTIEIEVEIEPGSLHNKAVMQ